MIQNARRRQHARVHTPERPTGRPVAGAADPVDVSSSLLRLLRQELGDLRTNNAGRMSSADVRRSTAPGTDAEWLALSCANVFSDWKMAGLPCVRASNLLANTSQPLPMLRRAGCNLQRIGPGIEDYKGPKAARSRQWHWALDGAGAGSSTGFRRSGQSAGVLANPPHMRGNYMGRAAYLRGAHRRGEGYYKMPAATQSAGQC